MKISKTGINLIKEFEGCKLSAYKPVATEKYYTIGYGHYGADVKAGDKISQAEAEALLAKDLVKFENAVNAYGLKWINQNRFDALVSFTYNCGAGNLKTLLNNGKRTAEEVSNTLPKYNKAGGKVLAGLTRRRNAEKELFDKKVIVTTAEYYPKYVGSTLSLVTALKTVGEKDTSFSHRKVIADHNGIHDYKGTPKQNVALLTSLKMGTLEKA